MDTELLYEDKYQTKATPHLYSTSNHTSHGKYHYRVGNGKLKGIVRSIACNPSHNIVAVSSANGKQYSMKYDFDPYSSLGVKTSSILESALCCQWDHIQE